MDKIPLLLDTDIGTDIDDSLALAYLLSHPQCKLLGITTVTGEPELRAAIADALCKTAGRHDIPIKCGCPKPMLVRELQPKAQQAEALGRWPHGEFQRDGAAVEFLRSTIRANPGKISLLAIGPLTNIGTLFTIDPEIPSLLKDVTIMGGQYFTRNRDGFGLEWNVRLDPYAAAIVFSAPIPKLTCVGLDVTMQVSLPADECRKRFKASSGPLQLVGDLAEVFFRIRNKITFHDPIAAALMFDPAICVVESGKITVDLDSRYAKGQTLLALDNVQDPYGVRDNGPTNHFFARSCDGDAFLKHYFEIAK